MSAADAARDTALAALPDTDGMAQAQEVMPGVWLGPYSVARDAAELAKIGVTHVVSLSAEGNCSVGGITYLEHPLVEVECTLQAGAQQLAALVPSCTAFVGAAVAEDSRVLVHCLHGRTRSAAMASCIRAVLLEEEFADAYEAVRTCRDVHVPEEWHAILAAAVNRKRKLSEGQRGSGSQGEGAV